MEVENAYYKKIIYKKNAFEDLKTYVKLNYFNKRVCLVSTKSIPAEDTTALLNSVFAGTESVEHFVARNNFYGEEITKLINKVSDGDFDLLISFGGGRCCDVVKYLAFKLNLPYVVCPSGATSLAYFTEYCVNPCDTSKSIIAKMPNKIFIQEGIIKAANCNTTINGLCFLHALRCVYIEGLMADDNGKKYIYLGLEKLFKKLEHEQSSILLCDEDSNLVLMDLFIDFGFFINMLNYEFYLYKVHQIEEMVGDVYSSEYVGKKLLLISKTIILIIKKYLELNFLKAVERPHYKKIAKMIKKYNISYKKIKNNNYFLNLLNNPQTKKRIIQEKEIIYNSICFHLLKIDEFIESVKNVFGFGMVVGGRSCDLMASIAIAPFVYGNNELIDYIAGSGVLNCFV